MRTWAWIAFALGAVTWQVAVLALTMGAVEADALGTDGTPPLWQPVTFVVASGLVVASIVALVRTGAVRA